MLAPLFIFVVAVVAGLGLTPQVIRLAGAWGLYDAPHGDRRVHTQPLPRLGGVAVFGAMAIGLLVMGVASAAGVELVGSNPGFFFGVLFGGGIIFCTGLIDDLRGLRPLAKITAQIVGASVVYAYGFRIDVLSLGPSSEFALEWLSFPVTVFWIVAVTNAFNLIDGLDGLASGIAVVALGTTLVVAFTLGNQEAVLLSMALLGALIGFFRYNATPARIFLGDSGSLFIGFMLAVLSVHGSYKSATAVLVLVPLFALAVPLLDTALAVIRRWLRGVPLSQADGRHIHHRLLAAGFTHRRAVLVLHLMALLLSILGLSLALAPAPATTSIAAAGGGVMLFIFLWGMKRLQYHEFTEAGSALVRGFGRLRRVIRDQICAQDVGELIARAETFEEVGVVLEESAASFGFLHLEVCRESATGSRPLVLFNGNVARAWKLDYPVMPHDFTEGDDYVLRIWCNPRNGLAPYGAERVAQILAPTVERRLAEIGFPNTTGRVFAHATNSERDAAELPEKAKVLDIVHPNPRVGAGVRPSA